MKKGILALLVILLALGLAVNAHAILADVEIVSPEEGAVIYGSFPLAVDVEMSIDLKNPNNGNCQTNAVNQIKVTATKQPSGTEMQIHLSKEDPIDNDGHICPAPYTFTWTVTEPGEYMLNVAVKHGGDYGLDDVTVEFLMLSVEYPAPPAVANAYLNSLTGLKKQLNGKVRGCIISNIAHDHTLQVFGPKGGPYKIEEIKEAVRDYSYDLCGGPEIGE